MRALHQLTWRTLLRAMAAAVALLLAVSVAWFTALVVYATAAEPSVARPATFTTQDIERALSVLKRHDPRWQRPGIVRAVLAEERDVNLLFAHLHARLPAVRGNVTLLPRHADARLSVDLPKLFPQIGPVWPLGKRPWLNVKATFDGGDALPRLQSLSIGGVPVPARLAGWLTSELLRRSGRGLDMDLLHAVVRHIDLRQGRALAFYAWQDDTSAKLLEALTPAADQERLRAYVDRLAAWTHQRPPGPTVALHSLLQPLFGLALERTRAGSDAVAENRAALLVATLYANRRSIAAIVPAARTWPRARWFAVTQAGRTDTPLHFLISASLAMESGTPLADAVGLYKELADSRGGSGFSFNDLAADRAGTRLGDMATRDATKLQQALARNLEERDLLPDIADLPESMSSSEFEARYGGVGAPAYARMVAEIEARLDTVPLLRAAAGPRP